MKFYAVQKGKKPGIYASWDECKENVQGVSGAIYKSFNSESEANAFLNKNGYETVVKKSSASNRKKSNSSDIDLTRYNGPIAFVDGSFNNDTKEYGYGVVIIEDSHNINEVHLNGKRSNSENATMQNVAGEILASMTAMKYALDHKFKKLTIFHDYEGIANWCTGKWKANKSGTKIYQQFYDYAADSITIDFIHVKGHSNSYYNDMVDALAKTALNIPLEKQSFASKLHPNEQ